LTAKIQKVYNIWYGLKRASALKNSTHQCISNEQEVKDENEKNIDETNLQKDEANDNKSKDSSKVCTLKNSKYEISVY
jgi:hypothetical protein